MQRLFSNELRLGDMKMSIIKPADSLEGGVCTESQGVIDLWFRANQGHTIIREQAQFAWHAMHKNAAWTDGSGEKSQFADQGFKRSFCCARSIQPDTDKQGNAVKFILGHFDRHFESVINQTEKRHACGRCAVFGRRRF